MYALVQHGESRAVDSAEFEAHRLYLDIQYLISGEEQIGVTSQRGLTISSAAPPRGGLPGLFHPGVRHPGLRLKDPFGASRPDPRVACFSPSGLYCALASPPDTFSRTPPACPRALTGPSFGLF
jgi:hypothetical protein